MKKTKIAINGFGRIGRAAFRIIEEREDCEVVAINDLTDNATLAHLLQYDTVFRKYPKIVSSNEKYLIVDEEKYPVFANPDPAQLPWAEKEVDIVLECTGFFVKDGAAYKHLDAGAKRVVISAPAKGEGDVETYVLGVQEPRRESTHVISNASCTTNCISPVMKVMCDEFGVEKSLMTTIHSYTSTQKLQDGPAKDLRKARAAAQNIIPTTTGAAIATTKVIPELVDRFDGMAMRVPTIDASIADITVVTKRDVTEEEVNNALISASAGELKGILGVTDEPLVSSDFIGECRSSVVDLSLTKVIGGNLVKVIAWYDNEWGYANRLVDMAVRYGKIFQ
ncbi:MAG: type I glyceraldehyde-3-phosphate dehydrogenase [Candidatus Moraniibacteriota bacterium]|nr:MAG: type I glyceraldehyde-3-phosphate dehydrogenase [Candidatus Moranbacteria bacterium]